MCDQEILENYTTQILDAKYKQVTTVNVDVDQK